MRFTVMTTQERFDCAQVLLYSEGSQLKCTLNNRRRDFERAGVADKFQTHPSAALQKARFNKPDAAYWMYQDTLLAIPSLALVLDAAFKAAGVMNKG